MKSKILFVESNVISLRTAMVSESNSLVTLRLLPATIPTPAVTGRKWWGPQDFEWIKKDGVWIFRRLLQVSGKDEGLDDLIFQNIKPLQFEKPPTFKLTWADSGHSVALSMNGEFWAFIDEESQRGYSKGIIDDRWGSQWSQKRFDELFGK